MLFKLIFKIKKMKATYFILSLSILFILNGCAQTSTNVNSLSAVEFQKIINTQPVVLVDVRTQPEFDAGHIAGAVNIDVNNPDFVSLVKKAVNNKPLAIYCRSGHRSKMAISKLTDFKNKIYELGNGFNDWQQSGLPVKK